MRADECGAQKRTRMSDTLTETPSETAKDTKAEADNRRKKPLRRKVGLVTLVVMAVLVVVLAVAAFAVIGRPLVAPDWLKTRIETQVNEQLRGAQIRLGEVSLVVEDMWLPRVQLHDVDVADAEGRHLIRLSDVEGTLALTPLFTGQVQPARIWLTGAQLVLRRDMTGQVGVSFDDTAPATRQAAGFVQLVEQLDNALVTPALADLKSFSADGLTIRYEDARAKQAWTVDGGRVGLTREGNDLTLRGDFSVLSGGSSAATVEMNYQSQVGSTAASFGMSFSDLRAADIAAQSGALLWLNVLRAPISGAIRASTDEAGKLGPLSATLQIDEGVLQPTDETQPIPFRAARSYFTYAPASQTMQFNELFVDSAWGAARAEGKVVLGALTNGLPQEFIGQLRLNEISANPKGYYAEPVRFSNVTMDTRLQLDPFRLSLGQVSLTDGDRKLVLGGELSAQPKGWDLSLSGRMDQLDPARLLQLWPEGLSNNTRDWIERNVLGGDLSNIQIGLRSAPEQKPVTYLGFEFSNLDTLFMKTMPPIEGARGHATLFRNVFTVSADAGRVTAEQGGALDISGTVFRIPDVQVKQGPAVVELKTRSTITAALSLLDREPFRFISKAGQKVTMADGIAVAQGRVGFSLKKKVPVEDVGYDVTAALQNVRSETLIPGRMLAASELTATADGTELRISGDARIGQVPVTGLFVAPLGKDNGGKSRVEGTIELSQRFVDEFRIGLPSGTVSGAGQGRVQIDMQRGQKPSFSLTSQLSGLGLRVPQIGWSIGKKTRGKLSVSGRLGEPVEVSRMALDAPGLKTSGSLVLGAGGSFREARFERVRAGSWLNAPVTLIGRGPGRAPEVQVTGGTVDLSQTEIGSGTGSSGSSGGGPLKVTLDRLRISDGIALTGFRGDFNTARGIEGSFAGKINGGAPVTGRVIPQKGRSAFRINSKNAGGVFQSAGLFPSARGGELDLTLVPGGGVGSYDGQLTVKSVWLRNAPAMAALLNAISVIGLLEQLSGNGILFNEVEARFRLTPKQAIITRSSAVGASMGISMDGYYNLATGAMNMQGTVSPFYLLNGVGSILTRKGEGLVGFTYRLKGTAKSPRVQVNPLSLLTPGMFREIFRRPPPKLSQ
jgi:hypothetical protein